MLSCEFLFVGPQLGKTYSLLYRLMSTWMLRPETLTAETPSTVSPIHFRLWFATDFAFNESVRVDPGMLRARCLIESNVLYNTAQRLAHSSNALISEIKSVSSATENSYEFTPL